MTQITTSFNVATGGGCSCCGGAACGCALFIPTGNPFPPASPYAGYATALAVVSDPLQVASCVAYFNNFEQTPLTSSATIGTNSLTLDQTFATFTEAFMWASVNLTSGETLSIACTGTKVDPDPMDPAAILINIYNCAGTLIHTDFVTGTSSHTFTYSIPADDAYTILVYFAGNFGGTAGWTAGNAVLSATTLTPNPVIALWDDSGTTRQLEACPKMLIPARTESTGTWYSDATAAATAITNLTSNCVGYIESKTNIATFTATDGGTSLTLAEALTVGATSAPVMWGSVNAVNGQTITVTGTAGLGTVGLNVNIYDCSGTLVQASGATSSPFVSSALPYHGRYIVSVAATSTLATVALAAVITSSGTLSVNPITAVYDIGLDCPARDDC